MSRSIVLEKSKDFAIRIINLCKILQNNRSEYILSKQLIRAGTSIGANITEAEFAISKKDFHAKMYIALKESVETMYWLELLEKTNYITPKEYESINKDCLELKKMLSSITKTTKDQNNKNKKKTNITPNYYELLNHWSRQFWCSISYTSHNYGT